MRALFTETWSPHVVLSLTFWLNYSASFLHWISSLSYPHSITLYIFDEYLNKKVADAISPSNTLDQPGLDPGREGNLVPLLCHRAHGTPLYIRLRLKALSISTTTPSASLSVEQGLAPWLQPAGSKLSKDPEHMRSTTSVLPLARGTGCTQWSERLFKEMIQSALKAMLSWNQEIVSSHLF